ncbi:fumarylacetoacetate hydrolase family protein [Halomonas sp. 86]|uniref:fumarylacetoacetate hydrolase family protein n=1 Tax=unclassified Halomonas TaxID=2609666 RepID=UPI00403383FD
MRFITFRHGGTSRAGIAEGDAHHQYVIDLSHASLRERLQEVEPHVAAFIDYGLENVMEQFARSPLPEEARIELSKVELCAPLPSPPRIIGVAHNYHDALAERGMTPPAHPVLFEKDPKTVVGPGQAIVLPPDIGGVTYEAELAAVIGRSASNVSIIDALHYVAGYTVFNDISASEMIRKDGYLERGKNHPTFGPLGPYLVSADEIENPQALKIQMMIEGEYLQDSSTSQMLFSVAELISTLSQGSTLEPGTVIATGTPAGVAPVRSPPTWLQPNTMISAQVERLGTLTNPVTEGKKAHV